MRTDWLLGLELSPQRLHHPANRLLIAPVPPPLPFFGRLHQPCLRQDGHVMRNSRLRKPDAFLNVSRTQTGSVRCRSLPSCLRVCFALLQSLQNPAPGRVSNGVKRTVERCCAGRHGWTRNSAEIDRCQCKKSLIFAPVRSPAAFPQGGTILRVLVSNPTYVTCGCAESPPSIITLSVKRSSSLRESEVQCEHF